MKFGDIIDVLSFFILWLFGASVLYLVYYIGFLKLSEAVSLNLTYTLIVITAWYVYLTWKQVSLIEKEKKANLISSSIKPKIEHLITTLEGNILRLKIELEYGHSLHERAYYSYKKLEYNLSVNLREIEEIDWLLDYDVMKPYAERIRRLSTEINSDVRIIRELIDKAHRDILRYPDLFESKARELKTYNEDKALIILEILLINATMLKLIDDATRNKLIKFYSIELNKESVDIEEIEIKTFLNEIDEIAKEIKLDNSLLNEIRETKNELINKCNELKKLFNELLSKWRKEYGIPEVRKVRL